MIHIDWNSKQCTSPDECRDCLEVCPQGVFAIYPEGGRKPGVPTTNWTIAPVWLSLCTGCEVCQEVCPQHAIAVSVA